MGISLLVLVLAVSVSAVEVARLFGSASDLGYYYVEIQVGTPPSRQTVIVDTGSHLTAFPCIHCPSCGNTLTSISTMKLPTPLRLLTASKATLV